MNRSKFLKTLLSGLSVPAALLAAPHRNDFIGEQIGDLVITDIDFDYGELSMVDGIPAITMSLNHITLEWRRDGLESKLESLPT